MFQQKLILKMDFKWILKIYKMKSQYKNVQVGNRLLLGINNKVYKKVRIKKQSKKAIINHSIAKRTIKNKQFQNKKMYLTTQPILQSSSQTIRKHHTYVFMFQCLGTFIFAYAIGCSHQQMIGKSQNFIHCFSILLPLALAGQVSGGYFNSSITLAAMVNKKHRIPLVYLGAQFLGGMIGAFWCWLITGKMVTGYGYEEEETIQLVKYIINELVGSFFFSVCVLTLTNKFTTHAYKSWQIYISIAASLYLIRKMTGDTALNPSIAIFYQIGTAITKADPMYLKWLWILIVPSTVGGILGGIFMYNVYEPLLLHTKFKDYEFDYEGEEGGVETGNTGSLRSSEMGQ